MTVALLALSMGSDAVVLLGAMGSWRRAKLIGVLLWAWYIAVLARGILLKQR